MRTSFSPGRLVRCLRPLPLVALFNLPLRMYGNLADNLVCPAVPMLLFMGVAWNEAASPASCWSA